MWNDITNTPQRHLNPSEMPFLIWKRKRARGDVVFKPPDCVSQVLVFFTWKETADLKPACNFKQKSECPSFWLQGAFRRSLFRICFDTRDARSGRAWRRGIGRAWRRGGLEVKRNLALHEQHGQMDGFFGLLLPHRGKSCFYKLLIIFVRIT